MNLNLSKIIDEKSFSWDKKDSWIQELISEINKDEQFKIENDLTIKVSISKPDSTSETYILDTSINTLLITECSKCLDSFTYGYEIKGNFTIIIDKTKKEEKEPEETINVTSKEEFLEIDDGNVITINNDIINLKELTHEIFYLNLPYMFVCDEECKGLCSHCGKNKNKETCNCETKSIKTNEFSKLKDLL